MRLTIPEERDSDQKVLTRSSQAQTQQSSWSHRFSTYLRPPRPSFRSPPRAPRLTQSGVLRMAYRALWGWSQGTPDPSAPCLTGTPQASGQAVPFAQNSLLPDFHMASSLTSFQPVFQSLKSTQLSYFKFQLHRPPSCPSFPSFPLPILSHTIYTYCPHCWSSSQSPPPHNPTGA